MSTASSPTLSSEKGTPVRLVFALSNGTTLLFNPLEFRAAGLSIEQPQVAREGKIGVLDDDGKEISKALLSPGAEISKIESFVIYPDGTTWIGRILDGKETSVVKMIWSLSLAKKLEIKAALDAFLVPDWKKRPTIVSILKEAYRPLCARIEHTCNDCEKFSKIAPASAS
jgi:hypothetical protein